LYPGQQTITDPEREPFPGTRHHLAWYRPDGWWRTGRRLAREVDLVVLTLFSPVQIPAHVGWSAGVRSGGSRTQVVVLGHSVLPHDRRAVDVSLTRALLRRADGVLTHGPEQSRLAQGLLAAGKPPPVTAPMPPHLPDTGGPTEGTPGERRHLLCLALGPPCRGVGWS